MVVETTVYGAVLSHIWKRVIWYFVHSMPRLHYHFIPAVNNVFPHAHMQVNAFLMKMVQMLGFLWTTHLEYKAEGTSCVNFPEFVTLVTEYFQKLNLTTALTCELIGTYLIRWRACVHVECGSVFHESTYVLGIHYCPCRHTQLSYTVGVYIALLTLQPFAKLSSM